MPAQTPRAADGTRAVTPPVRAAARLGVDLERVQATGVGGRVSLADVRAAAGMSRIVASATAPPARSQAGRPALSQQTNSLGQVLPAYWQGEDDVEQLVAAARAEGRISAAAAPSFTARLLAATDPAERARVTASLRSAAPGTHTPARRVEPALPPPAPARVAASAASGARPGASQVAAAAYAQHASTSYVRAAAAGTAMPTAFPAGDLPVMTASGVEPSVVGLLPWQARWAAARAETRGEVAAMIEEYQSAFGDDMAAVHAMSGGPFFEDVQRYSADVSNWLVGADQPGYSGPVFS